MTRVAEYRDRSAGLERRRDAARRLSPIACGCRDPWVCRHHDGQLSEQAVDGAADAARHLLVAGLLPMLDVEVQRRLWRRGGLDRRLVSELQALAVAS